MHGGRVGVAVLCVLTVLAPAASPAAPQALEGRLLADGEVRLEGARDLHVDAIQAIAVGPASVAFHAGAHLLVLDEAVVRAPGATIPLPPRTVADERVADLVLQPGPGATLLLRAAAEATFRLETATPSVRLGAFDANAFLQGHAYPTPDAYGVAPTDGCGMLPVEGGRLTTAASAMLTGGQASDGATTWTIPGNTTTGGLPGRAFAIATDTAGPATLTGAWLVCATSLAASATSLEATDVRSTHRLDERLASMEGGLLTATGKLEVAARHDGQRAVVDLSGTVEALALDGFPTWAATAAAGTFLAVSWWWLPYLAAVVAGHRAAPQGHPNRVRILEALAATPGMTAPGIGNALGLSTTAARFHCIVLLRAGLLRSDRIGAREHFHVRTQHQGRVAALLSHPVRRAVAAVLAAAPEGLTYAQMAQRWRSAGLAPAGTQTLVSYHLELLRDEGFVGKLRRGRSVAWRLLVPLEADDLRRRDLRSAVVEVPA